MQFDAPVSAPEMTLRPEWIDYNGHLNMAYYNVLFDRASDHAFDLLGCGAQYRKTRNMSVYTAEIHVVYVRELSPDSRVTATFQLLEHDDKRLRVFQTLKHGAGWTAATSEVLYLHVDMTGPKAAPFPTDIRDAVEAMMRAHASLPAPDGAGKGITLARKNPA